MGLINYIKSLTPKVKVILSCAAVLLIAAIVCIAVFARKGYVAKTMRLLRFEGTVSIEDGMGGSKPVTNNIRFQSGNALNTGADGIASVGLDDTKIITLQNDSRAEFQKKGKRLELKLTKGAVFFNVTEKLKADETFEIKTSTMTAGIRGTSGMIYFDTADGGRESLVVTDGVVEISATNPVTGETKTARVEGGNKIKVYLFNDRTEDSVEFELDAVTEDNLDSFALQNIADNDELMDRVAAYTGWDKEKLKKAIKDLDTENTQDPSETPTPVPTEETTEDESAPTPAPVTSPTFTPTPSPEPTITPVPTPTNKPASAPKATNTPTSTPTPTPTVNPEPTVPSGYQKLAVGWGEKFEGRTIYMCSDSNSNYLGYFDGSWVKLIFERGPIANDGGSHTDYYKFESNGEIYYSVHYKAQQHFATHTPTSTVTSTPTNTPTSTPTNTPTSTPTCTPTDIPGPAIPDGYYRDMERWGIVQNGRTIYIMSPIPDPDAVMVRRTFYGYVDGAWQRLLYSTDNGMTYLKITEGSQAGQAYYIFPD